MTLLRRLAPIFGPVFSKSRRAADRADRRAAGDLYDAIVAAARREGFYRDLSVPDTLDGRFELVALHTVLTCRRLAADGEEGAEIGQRVFDRMISDLDLNLRELGVNDPSLGKRVKEMARAFFGRRDAYAAALDSADPENLKEALGRNLYGTADAPGTALDRMTGYVTATAEALREQPLSNLRQGDIAFPDVPA